MVDKYFLPKLLPYRGLNRSRNIIRLGICTLVYAVSFEIN